jgi:4-aminobutyrate aminotransferase/4-aminobutyrate aminotransferase/(S)-3-amino-2-methylpropionate transaminase
VIDDERLCVRAVELGARLTERLRALAAVVPQIAEVRGVGAMVAVEFRDPATGQADAAFTKKVQAHALSNGLLLLSCGVHGNVIRFLFPLTISDALLEEALALLEQALVQ